MLGVYYLVFLLTMADLRTPDLVWSGLFFSSLVIGCWTVTVMLSPGGYLGAYTCSVSFSWLMSRSMLVYGITGSSSASIIAWKSWRGSCGAWYLFLSAACLSTPMILMSTIGRPMRSAKRFFFLVVGYLVDAIYDSFRHQDGVPTPSAEFSFRVKTHT